MAITKAQREQRKRFIGASDVSALFGLDPNKNIADVYGSKVLDLPEKDAAHLSRGRRYEPPLIQFAEEELGRQIITDPDKIRFVCDDEPALAANLDGLIPPENAKIIECKTSVYGERWGDPGSDEIPESVIIQCQAQLACYPADEAIVAALLGRRGAFEGLYTVKRNDEIIAAIKAKVRWFVDEHIEPKLPPMDIAPMNIELFKRANRVQGSLAVIPPDVIIAWDELRKHRLEAEKAEKEAFGKLFLLVGENDSANLPDGRLFTYYGSARSTVDIERLKADFPESYAAVLKESMLRTARIKNG